MISSIYKGLPNHQKCSKKYTSKFNNVEELFLSKLKEDKNKKLLFFPEEQLNYSYHEFYNEYKKISKIFISKKFKKKDKVAIVFNNLFCSTFSWSYCSTN